MMILEKAEVSVMAILKGRVKDGELVSWLGSARAV